MAAVYLSESAHCTQHAVQFLSQILHKKINWALEQIRCVLRGNKVRRSIALCPVLGYSYVRAVKVKSSFYRAALIDD